MRREVVGWHEEGGGGLAREGGGRLALRGRWWAGMGLLPELRTFGGEASEANGGRRRA